MAEHHNSPPPGVNDVGVYRIWWKEDPDGYSVAAVGRDNAGRLWLAPSNWINGIPWLDWSLVERVELIEAAHQGRGD